MDNYQLMPVSRALEPRRKADQGANGSDAALVSEVAVSFREVPQTQARLSQLYLRVIRSVLDSCTYIPFGTVTLTWYL